MASNSTSKCEFKVGETYYKLVDTWKGGEDCEGRWRIASWRLLSESRKTVTVRHTKSGRVMEINKPWNVFVSPWDAVDSEAQLLLDISRSIREESAKAARDAEERAAGYMNDRQKLLKFRDTIEIDP